MLSETGQRPRRSPLRGRYLVHFGPLNRALALCDAALARLIRRSRDPTPAVTSAPRILVSQPGHLGDVVIATAVIEPLKSLFPGCRVGFLVASWASVVLEGHAGVDAVHVHDHALLNRSRGWRARIARHRATRRLALRDIRSRGYDVAIELSFNFPNNVALLRAASIPVRIGYTSGGLGPLLTHPVAWRHHPDWSVMRYHDVLVQQLVPPDNTAPRVVRSTLPAAPRALAGAPRPWADSEYTIVHMGSGGARKEWPASRWGELVDALLAQGRRLVFTGAGAHESAQIAAIVGQRAGCTNLGSKLDWHGFVEAIAGAELVVAVDSAAGHVAATFDVPTVTIAHGMTDAALFKPTSAANTALRETVPCLPCYRSRGCPSMDCIRGVTAENVLAALP